MKKKLLTGAVGALGMYLLEPPSWPHAPGQDPGPTRGDPPQNEA